MTATCAPDQRLKAVGYLPLNDPGRALDTLAIALDAGVAAVWVPSDAPGDFSPAHVDLDPVWACLAEAGVPFVLHVGGGKLLPKAFHNNGRPRPKDWLGGGENLRSKDFPVLHHSPERFLACMTLDGVFERFPTLRGAAIELGANVGAGAPSQRRSRAALVLEVRAGTARAQPSALRVPPPPGPLHAVPLRGHGLVARAVRPGALHVLDGLPASRRWEAAVRGVRRCRGGVRRDDARAVLLAQRGGTARPRLSERRCRPGPQAEAASCPQKLRGRPETPGLMPQWQRRPRAWRGACGASDDGGASSRWSANPSSPACDSTPRSSMRHS